MKTDEEILKRGTGNFINCTDYDDAMQALGDLRSETKAKAMLFAEWTSVAPNLFHVWENTWEIKTLNSVREFNTPKPITTAELFASPEFLEYYQERKSK